MGTTRSFTATPNASAVPTALIGGTCKKRMSTGAVMMPAPTPVTPMATAIRNPRTISIGLITRDVDSALELASRPAARAQVFGIHWRRGAGLAADAGIALVVERKNGDAAAF